MPQFPSGEPAPPDGILPESALAEVGSRPFGAYVHIPFCAARCGYCDFNTYTPSELDGETTDSFVESVLREIALARAVVPQAPPLTTVFFGGGTPTRLRSADLAAILHRLAETFGLGPDVEVTTEANPESVDQACLLELHDAGFNRISFGMQSAVPHVLTTLDRQHTPGQVEIAVAHARAAGFENLSLDLIYGTPGESLADWQTSLEAAVALEPEHFSAYALTVEPGTRLAQLVAQGALSAPDDDDQAAKYELADELLTGAGYQWYEVSNWAKDGGDGGHKSRHNMSYWLGHHWWGFGPGAHSHVGGARWWNVKHPRTYTARLSTGLSPALEREVLDAPTRALEQIMLTTRLRRGLDRHELLPEAAAQAEAMALEGLIQPTYWAEGHLVLTRQGRLLADLVVRRLTKD